LSGIIWIILPISNWQHLGKMASKYNLGKFLGEGTWGSVYEATRRSDGLQVAVKRIKPMDPSLGMNFTALREVKYLRELKNVNVVDVRIIYVLSKRF
jgi:cyclin-dependent kinase 7